MALPAPSPAAIDALAPTGVLRAAINLSNFLLVTGRSADGNPEGVSPDMAATLAERLGADLELLQYKTPAAIADDAGSGNWDIGNIGAEPARAELIDFTTAYCEIESTYIVPAGSPITSIDEVDQPGHKIASADRSAYGLWLDRNIEHAEIINASGLEGSFEAFVEQGCDALAGLLPRLLTDVERLPGARILEGRFTAVQQAMGTPRGRDQAGFDYLKEFVEATKAQGVVADLITRHEVQGLAVAPFRPAT
ncbi:MAG: transporter substrate-binding domain-containing protein [Actinomycetia bacterium]|nr:transporter substrate-binding domain-containing protein [Actinomycetes bacterium]